jgi:DNA polymerase III epsilon subunit family exonuclease
VSFTIIDIETTGLSKYTDKITEIAAAKFHNGELVESFQTLVNPQVKIPRFITKLTGIDNELVRSAPTIRQVLPSFIEFLGDDIFVAHNATFDFGFLDHNMKLHHNKEIKNKTLCTRKLANRLLPNLPRRRLQDLCECFDVTNNQAHRALGDVHATVKVFKNLLKMLDEKGMRHASEIIAFERSARQRSD